MTDIVELKVYEFRIGDVDDPEIYAASPLWEWERTEQGKWVMENAIESPVYYRDVDPASFGHKFSIMAKLKAQDAVFFKLKWGKFA